MNERIEQAARKYGCDAYIEYCWQHGVDAATAKYPPLEKAFITGAEWMLRNVWISVDEEKPCADEIVAKLSDDFCCGNGRVEILHYCKQDRLRHPKGYYDLCGENVPTSAIEYWFDVSPLEGGEK